MTRLVYFAWVREKVGVMEEEFAIPETVATVGDLITTLAARDETYAAAFCEPTMIRTAIDKIHAEHDAPVAGADEIAFFPPMTGG
jgi:molybdopterin synthase sulfur carrier subunit